MQVSWIDPDEISSLARQLIDPQPNRTSGEIEVQRLSNAVSLASAPLIDAGPEPSAAHVASPELEQIRAKLRHIRDRAKHAGLLPDAAAQTTTSPFPPAPVKSFPSPPTPAPILPQTTAASKLASTAFEPTPVPVPIPDLSASATAATQPVPSPSSAFRPEEGPIADRLHDFAEWAIDLTNSQDFLVLDEHGDILWGVPNREELVVHSLLMIQRAKGEASPAPLSQAFRTINGENKQLTVLLVPTRYGRVTVCLLSANSPNDLTLHQLRDALTLAIDEARVN